MEENILPNQPNPPMPSITPPKTKPPLAKIIYLTIFTALLLLLLAIIYLIFINPKLKKSTTKTESKQATIAAKPKEENFSVGYVTAIEGLNLRQNPSSDSAKILLLPNGTEVQIISHENEWLFVEAQTKGFVAKEFISPVKPTTTVLKTFKGELSPFSFLYPDLYKITFTKTEGALEYSFTGNDSFGGFKVETTDGFSTLGNYALKNYPSAKRSSCSVQFATSRKECEELTTDTGTLYLLLINTSLYKISYLKTEGGLLTDIKNLVFYSMFFK